MALKETEKLLKTIMPDNKIRTTNFQILFVEENWKRDKVFINLLGDTFRSGEASRKASYLRAVFSAKQKRGKEKKTKEKGKDYSHLESISSSLSIFVSN